MAEQGHHRRFSRALESLESVPDPLERLDAVRRYLELLADLETRTVTTARANGATWSEIGALYGLSKQGAQQRFRRGKPAEADDVEPTGTRRRARPRRA